jgi:hypothetical protein
MNTMTGQNVRHIVDQAKEVDIFRIKKTEFKRNVRFQEMPEDEATFARHIHSAHLQVVMHNIRVFMCVSCRNSIITTIMKTNFYKNVLKYE